MVLACAGDVPTIETLAAVEILRREIPELRIRVINVVDLMTLQPHEEHPDGLNDRDFDGLFTTDRPIIFAFHGYPWLIHRLAYRRTNHRNLHVRGYKEKRNINTPLELAISNEVPRSGSIATSTTGMASSTMLAVRRNSLGGRLVSARNHASAIGATSFISSDG